MREDLPDDGWIVRAAERFRRIKGHGELGALVTALGALMAPERAA